MSKRIRLTCNWCDDKSLYDRFCRVYLSNKNANKGYNFTLDDDYDFLVIINGPRYPVTFPKEKTIGVIMEPSHSPSFQGYRPYLENLCSHILWHHKVDSSQYIFYPGLLPFHMDYDHGENLDSYVDRNFLKTSLCSFIVSYNEVNVFPTCIYNDRVNFAKRILETDLDVDIYGNGWENCPIKDTRIKGTLKNKKDGLTNYKFSIAVENCVEENYFSEKFTDCVLTNTIPIYFGCPNIENYFKGTLKLSDLKTSQHLEQILKTNDTIFSLDKHVMVSKYNLYTAIVKYLERK